MNCSEKRPVRNLKISHPRLVKAMQADCKSYPGGIVALASDLGINGTNFSNSLNINHDTSAPAFWLVIEIILRTGGERTLVQLKGFGNDDPVADMDIKDAMPVLMNLVNQASKFTAEFLDRASDGDVCTKDKFELEEFLLNVQKATDVCLRAVRN